MSLLEVHTSRNGTLDLFSPRILKITASSAYWVGVGRWGMYQLGLAVDSGVFTCSLLPAASSVPGGTTQAKLLLQQHQLSPESAPTPVIHKT